jgi:hypothetical protein
VKRDRLNTLIKIIIGIYVFGIQGGFINAQRNMNDYHGSIMQVVQIDSVGNSKTTETFDKKGNLITKNISGLDSTVKLVITCTYDTSGRLISYIRDNIELDDYSEEIVVYNNKGLILSSTTYNRSHQVQWCTIFKYDKHGNVILASERRNPRFKTVFRYSKDRTLLVEREFQKRLFRIRIYRFNADGKETEKTGYDSKGRLIGRNTWCYDEEGRLVEWTSFVNDTFRRSIYVWGDQTMQQTDYEGENVTSTSYVYWKKDEYQNILFSCKRENSTTTCSIYTLTYYK